MQRELKEESGVSWSTPVLKKGEIGKETQASSGGGDDGLSPS